ncbi:hypothetical protein, partial [Enterobacter hormaechei]|uniref:hypothetical protein n=1 Tax=Enterobacter hormaechei TaxID=158836 RepID=UPI001E510EA2
EWVHVQLHQQKGMISLSPPTICNSALFSYAVRAWKATTPELNGHRPQIAGNRNAERIARPSPLPAKP